MFAAMKPYAVPPPPGAQPPPPWGDEAHVRDLFGDRVTDVDARVQSLTVDHFTTPEEFRDYFKHVRPDDRRLRVHRGRSRSCCRVA